MKSYVSLVFVLLSFSAYETRSIFDENVIPENIKNVYDPDTKRSVTELITSKGYPAENYTVQTEDGFLLGVQRIPHGQKESKDSGKKPVVFLQHGLLSAASDFVMNFPGQSLGFLLADDGYDVWLGNTRGNTYSRRHVNYTTESYKFWNYSFDEMARYDLPAMIDFVLNHTGQDKLTYIGHSQGTTSAFALLSERPEYNKKLDLFIALAPVATVGYLSSGIKYLAPFTKEVDLLLWMLGVKEFLPNNELMKFLSKYVCDTEAKFVCEDIMFLLFGTDYAQLNQTRIAVYAAHTPAGSSAKSVVHYAQMVNSKKFLKYDYGFENYWRYHQKHPPEYDVSKITTPTALVWSANDKLADPVDVELLKEKLKSLVSYYEVPFALFNHGDFVIALHAKELVYDHVLDLLHKYVK